MLVVLVIVLWWRGIAKSPLLSVGFCPSVVIAEHQCQSSNVYYNKFELDVYRLFSSYEAFVMPVDEAITLSRGLFFSSFIQYSFT